MHSHQNCSWLKLKVNRQKMAAPNIGLQWDTVYIFPVWRRSWLSFFFIWIPERLTLIIWNDRFVMITLFDTPEKQTCVKVLLASASSLPKYTERRRTSDLNSRIKVSITRIQLNLHFYQQGGRTWQAFGGGKNGHETFRQARIYNFRDKCVVFARNLKFSNLTQ